MPFLPFTSVKRTPRPVKAKDREHLIELIGEEMERSGHECSLNHIDVSEVTSMSAVFEEHPTFNGDISQWDTSRVEDMSMMFEESAFDGDIAQWVISKKCMTSFAFNRYHPSVLGMMCVLQQEVVESTIPQEVMPLLRMVQALDVPLYEAAQLLYHETLRHSTPLVIAQGFQHFV